MAALTNAELPTGFTTIEQLAVYLSITMSTIYPDNTYLLTATNGEKISDRAIVRTFDGRDFFIGRYAIPLDAEYTTPTLPLWTYAQENGNIAIPARFKA